LTGKVSPEQFRKLNKSISASSTNILSAFYGKFISPIPWKNPIFPKVRLLATPWKRASLPRLKGRESEKLKTLFQIYSQLVCFMLLWKTWLV
jgi:hypothetical protein